jgi:septum formation protein
MAAMNEVSSKHSVGLLVLASASPRRRELLGLLGVRFEVMEARVVEQEDGAAEPRAMVLHNAALKAAWMCARRPGAWVLAADTAVALPGADGMAGEVLNKPRDLAEARGMLRKLSGRTHVVYTGVCLWRRFGAESQEPRVESGVEEKSGRLGDPSLPRDGAVEISHCEMSEVTFRVLDEARIEAYLARVNPLDKAGAYGIQEGRELILARYAGSFSNIMGLPLEWVAARLQELTLLPGGAVPRVEDRRFRDDSRPSFDKPVYPPA